MMKKKLIQTISFNDKNFKIGTIFLFENKKWYASFNGGYILVPSYINMNDKNYFENIIEQKFVMGETVIYDGKIAYICGIHNYIYQIISENFCGYVYGGKIKSVDVKFNKSNLSNINNKKIMKKKLIKEIPVLSGTFKVGNIFYNKNGEWFLDTTNNDFTLLVPSYINMNSDYFEDYFEGKYKHGDLVVHNNRIALVESFSIFKLYRINYVDEISQSWVVVHENELKLIDKYYFIDACGEIQKTTYGKSEKSDIFRFKNENIFVNKEQARKMLNEIMKR